MADIYPFDNDILNNIVFALFDIKLKTLSAAAGGPVRPPLPSVIPRRKRSRQINLEGIRAAKREIEEEAQKEAFALMAAADDHRSIPCNGGSRVPNVGPSKTRKKASKAPLAAKRAGKDLMPTEPPKFIMHEAAPLKLVLRKVQSSETKMVTFDKKDDRKGKRKIDDTGLAEDNISNPKKKVKLMCKSLPEPMSTAFTQSEAAETCVPASSSAQRAPFNQM